MHRLAHSIRSFVAFPLALALAAAFSIGFAFQGAGADYDPVTSHPAHLHAGTCDAPGDIVFPLSNVSSEYLVDGTPAAGADLMGPGNPIPVKISQTTVAATLFDIVTGGHTLVVHESDDAIENYIACGDVGGVLLGSSDLGIALAEVNDSGYFGTVRFGDNGDGTTNVSLFIVHNDQVDDGDDDSTGGDDGTSDDAGDDDDDDSGSAATESAVQSSAPVAVAIVGFAFVPETIEISVGDMVTWTNNDGTGHTVTQDGSGFQSGTVAGGGTFSQTFDTAGTFAYHCEFHPMNGTVIVS